MRHTLRLATGARAQRAEPEKGSRGWEVPRGGVAPASSPGGAGAGAGTAGREGRREGRPGGRGGSITCAPGGGSLAGAHRGTYLPTVWLASWRMRLNCFFIVAPLPRWPGSWARTEQPGARRRLHGSRAEPPGRRRRHCGASGSRLARARGSLPRAPPPTPPPAAAPAAASSSRAPPRLHGDARGRPRRRPGPPGRLPPAPLRRGDPGVSAGCWPAGRVVPAAPVRRAPCILGLVVLRPAAHLSACKVCKDRGARRAGGEECFAL